MLTPFVDYPCRLKGFLGDNSLGGAVDPCVFHVRLSDIEGAAESEVVLKSSEVSHCGIEGLTIDHMIEVSIHAAHPNGVIVFAIDTELYWAEREIHVAKQVYVILKHIYHQHTHHHQDDDMLLLPEEVGGVDDENLRLGVQRIINQYIEKIIIYHKTLRQSLWYSPRNVSNILTEFNKAMGEMLYAKHFLALNKGAFAKSDLSDNLRAVNAAADSFGRSLSVFAARLNKKNVDIAYSVYWLSMAVFLVGGLTPLIGRYGQEYPFWYLSGFLLAGFIFYGLYHLITREKRD